ncbi:hypothetical protein GCM10010400_30730 [Streptomyces aculeolatus]
MTDKQGISRRGALRASLAGAAASAAVSVAAPGTAAGAESAGRARNVEAVGYSDLEHRPAFKMAVRQKHGRWYLYTGHFWDSGWSVVDVTDPARPEVVLRTPGPCRSTCTATSWSPHLSRSFPTSAATPAHPSRRAC